MIGLVLWMTPLGVEAAVPSSFSVQGVLRSASGALQSMPVTVTVKLFATQTGGSELATPVMAQSVMASSGLFTLNVPVTPALATVLSANPQLWLELTVNTDVYPRQPLTSNVYALYAGTADVANSVSSSATIAGSQLTGTINGSLLGAGSVAGAKLSGSGAHAHGLDIVQASGSEVDLPASGSATAHVDCPSGYVVLGGACYAPANGATVMQYTNFTGGPPATGWSCNVKNGGPDWPHFFAQAMCIRASTASATIP